MARDADQLYDEMLKAVACGRRRMVSDVMSPMRETTLEAPLACSFNLRNPTLNVVSRKSICLKWATANAIHFFASTEEADMLPRYNARAERFAPNGVWRGAYGALAMPQIRTAIERLKRDCTTRRAVVTMPTIDEDINNPPCWTSLHFLFDAPTLDMIVYQRSLNLHGVMPYDLVVLSNILLLVADESKLEAGTLRWIIGSLHTTSMETSVAAAPDTLRIPHWLARDPAMCLQVLRRPEQFVSEPLSSWLQSQHEVRT